MSIENYQNAEDIKFQPQNEDTIVVEDVEVTKLSNAADDAAVTAQAIGSIGLFEEGSAADNTLDDVVTCATATGVGSAIGAAIGGAIGGVLGVLGGPAAPATIPAGIAAGAQLGASIGGPVGLAGCATGAGINRGNQRRQEKQARQQRQEDDANPRSFWEGLGMADFFDDVLEPIIGTPVVTGGSAQPGKGGNPTEFAMETRAVNLARLQARRDSQAQSDAMQTAALVALALGGVAAYKLTK